jgi:hypothetical protein
MGRRNASTTRVYSTSGEETWLVANDATRANQIVSRQPLAEVDLNRFYDRPVGFANRLISSSRKSSAPITSKDVLEGAASQSRRLAKKRVGKDIQTVYPNQACRQYAAPSSLSARAPPTADKIANARSAEHRVIRQRSAKMNFWQVWPLFEHGN